MLIDARHDTDNSKRIIIDAKFRTRKIDITHVEAFKGLMEDVGATHGYLIGPVGHTAAAEKRAQELITISLVPPNDLDGFDYTKWPECLGTKCKNGRVFWDGIPQIYIKAISITGPNAGKEQTFYFNHQVGKCDRCGRFHVKCLTCNDFFSLNDTDGIHRCSCTKPWFWLTSVESDEFGELSAELHLVQGMGKVSTVDRRPLTKRRK